MDKMGLCVAYGCNTESGVHRISMFTFPKDPKRRKLWIDRLNRGQSATKSFAPNSHSKLCIKHFDDNQFIIHPTFAEQIGYGGVRRVRLKPDAVPTIFEKPKKPAPKERLSAAAILRKKMKQELIGGLKVRTLLSFMFHFIIHIFSSFGHNTNCGHDLEIWVCLEVVFR